MSLPSLPGSIDLPDDFDGQVRLFPLPGLVLFPHAMQPLHLFEPRYVEMLGDALATDQLITMATLTDPNMISLGTPPPIDETVCIGRIVSHARLEEDRHNILLVGIRRARIRRELDAGRPFRMAHVDLIDDFYLPAATKQRGELKRKLLVAFGNVIPSSNASKQSLQDLMEGQMGVGPITDIIAYTLPLPQSAKLKLLAMADVDARATALIRILESGEVQLESAEDEPPMKPTPPSPYARQDKFPPPFSVN